MAVAHKDVALSALKRLLPPNQVVTNRVELMTYEVDAAMDRGQADGVVLAHNTADVVRAVKWANEHGVPLIARGAGTGLSGGAVPEHGGVVVEFSRMNRVLEFDTAGRSVVVQPGVINLQLDELVKTKGLYFPPDPASGRTSTLGGNLAENAGGPHCFKYGVTTNYITGLEVVLADGRALRLGGRAFDYPEYDLVGLLVGNEGTLAIITEASGRLIRNPLAVKTALAAFNTLEEAGDAVSAVIARGLIPATLEMMDQKGMRIIEAFSHAGYPVEGGAGLIIETDGYPESVTPQMDEITATLREFKVSDLRIAKTPAERDRIWYGRKSAAGAFALEAPFFLTLDGTVPRSKLARTLTAIRKICEDLGLSVCFIFHAGDGNLHPDIFFDPTDEAMVAKVHQAWAPIMQLCVDAGGSITGEHGVGMEKRAYMKMMFSDVELQALAEFRDIFDPKQLLNPGKILPADIPPMVAKTAPATKPPAEYVPTTAEEAAEALLAWGAGEPTPVRVRGGGTKSSMLASAPAMLSTSALCGISDRAIEDLYVTVRAGTPLKEMQEDLAKSGMWVPLQTPWAAATAGGTVATNFNAPLRMRYGGLRDLVLAMTLALPDGRVLRAGRPVVKNVAGYDLPKLFTGSYGTLGLITDITFKLTPLPRSRATMVVPVEDMGRGLKWAAKALRVCLVASSLLLVRGEDVPGVNSPYAMVFTAEGVREDVAAECEQMRQVLSSEGLRNLPEPQWDAPSGSDLWAAWMRRHTTAGPLMRAGVAPKDFPALVTGLAAPLGAAPFVADVASGLLYVQTDQVAAVRNPARVAGGYGLVLSGMAAGAERFGYIGDGTDVVKQIKARWDPKGILNPGAFLL